MTATAISITKYRYFTTAAFTSLGGYEDNGIEKGGRRELFPNICDILPFLWTILQDTFDRRYVQYHRAQVSTFFDPVVC